MQFKIPEVNLDWVKEKLEKLNKRAIKLDCLPITLTVLGEEYIEKQGKTVKYLNIEIEGEAPIVNGWSFAATIIHEDGGNIFKKNPSFVNLIPEHYRTAESTNCDHCNTQRYRKDTYILYNGVEWKQVGRSCLKDFLGHIAPERIAQWAEIIMDIDGVFSDCTEERGYRAPQYDPLIEVLTTAAYLVRNVGYKSRKKVSEEGGCSTGDMVNNFLHDFKALHEWIKDYGAIQEVDKEMAMKVIIWASNLEVTLDNDYLWNLNRIALNEWVQTRLIGIASSMIIAYRKAMEPKELPLEDAYYGVEGDKFETEAKFLHEIIFETQWGVTHVYKFVIDNKLVVWKTGTALKFVVGEIVKIKGRIKAHSVFRDKKQTMVERVKVLN